MNKKIFADTPCDDPRAPPSGVTAHVQSVAGVLDGERFALAVSYDRFQTAATAAGFSIGTSTWPSSGIPRCSSAPSDVSAEISFRIPSTNTLGFAAGVVAACSVALCMGVALSAELTDLDWGSWEGLLPESSSLGGDCTPLRGAFVRSGIQELTTRKTLSTSWGWRHFHRHQLVAAWLSLVRPNGPFFRRHQQLRPTKSKFPRD